MKNEPAARLLLTACALYCKEQGINGEMDCFHSKSKTLGFIEKNWPKSGIALMSVLIGELADSFNIGKNMTGDQVLITALMITTEYPNLKVDDVAFCFSKAMKGYYGKVYDRLDTAIIFGWLEQFQADKQEQVDYYWSSGQKELKKNSEGQLLIQTPEAADNDTSLKYINAIRKDVIAIQRRNNALRRTIPSKPIEENLIQKIHNKWMKDFQDLWEKEDWASDKPLSGTRFIPKYNRMMDIGEYLQRKHYQLMMLVDKINQRWNIS